MSRIYQYIFGSSLLGWSDSTQKFIFIFFLKDLVPAASIQEPVG